jgi:hypothetical protein
MRIITRNELRTLLLAQTAATIVSMVCVTPPDMRANSKDGEPNPYRVGKGKAAYLTVGKVNKVNGNIAGRYERIVENRLEREIISERMTANLPPLPKAELEAEIQARFIKGESWHRPIMADDGPTCLSVNKKDQDDNGSAYVRFIFKAKGEAEYLSLDDGATVESEKVYPYLSDTSNYSNQGLSEENTVKFVVYSIENIVEIAIGGERYRIADNFTDRPTEMRQRIWDIAEEYLSGDRKMATV